MSTPIVTSKEKKESGMVSVECSLPWEEVQAHEEEALVELGKNVKIQGFREGHVPTSVLKKSIGDMRVAEEAARIAIRHAYPDIIREINEDLIGAPSISITKLAPGNNLEFRVELFLAPTVTLGDYTSIAHNIFEKEESTPVNDAEVEEGIVHIQKQFARSEKWETLRKEAEEKGEEPPLYSDIDVKGDELPPLSDEFVQKIGAFKTVEEFRNKFKETLTEEKALRAHDKKLGETIEEIINSSSFSIPHALIEGEALRLEHDFSHSLEKAGLTMEEYSKEQNVSREELRTRWENDAERKLKTQLVLEAIAKTENITPDESRVEEETKKILSHYKDAEEEGAKQYAQSILTNRAVLDYLASLGKQ
jgi:trigger factor